MKMFVSLSLIALFSIFLLAAPAGAQSSGAQSSTGDGGSWFDLSALIGNSADTPPTPGRTAENLRRYGFMLAAAIGGGLASEFLFDIAGPYSIVMAGAAAVLSDWWYKEDFWPFGRGQAVAQTQPMR